VSGWDLDLDLGLGCLFGGTIFESWVLGFGIGADSGREMI